MLKFINKTMEEELYHYTSINALCNIIKNKELWLFNLATMNDREECIKFYQQFKMELKAECEEKANEIDSMFDEAMQNNEGHYPLAMCFSKLKDDAAQWERYGDNARGVMLAFNVENLSKLLHNLPFVLDDVIYSDTTTIKKYRRANYGFFLEYFRTGHVLPSDLQQHIDEDEYVKEWSEMMINMASCYKHGSFFSEKESRLFNYVNYEINKHLFFGNDAIELTYENINGTIKKLLKIKLDYFFNKQSMTLEDIINEIVIGPCSSQNLIILQEYIRSYKFNRLAEKISYSESPLR